MMCLGGFHLLYTECLAGETYRRAVQVPAVLLRQPSAICSLHVALLPFVLVALLPVGRVELLIVVHVTLLPFGYVALLPFVLIHSVICRWTCGITHCCACNITSLWTCGITSL